MTRQCTCGGIIRQHELVGGREAWTCNDCGKYSAIQRAPFQSIFTPEQREAARKLAPEPFAQLPLEP